MFWIYWAFRQGDLLKPPEVLSSPAEILLPLLEHKQSPTNAVTIVEEWVTKTKEKKSKFE